MTLGDRIRAFLTNGLPDVAQARDSYMNAIEDWTRDVHMVLRAAKESLSSSEAVTGCRVEHNQNHSCELYVKIDPIKLSSYGNAGEREREYVLSIQLDRESRTIAPTVRMDGRTMPFTEVIDPRDLDEPTIEAHVLRFVEVMVEDLEQLYKPNL